MSKALVSDIGGTNARLLMLSYEEGQVSILRERNLKTHNYPNIVQCLRDFIEEGESIQFAIIGVAGPTNNNTCLLTNAGWSQVCTAQEVQEAFNIPSVQFYNDFVIAGYGILDLNEDDYVQVNGPVIDQTNRQPKSVLGPGTGLGVCFLTYLNGQYTVWPAEGGHLEFCPQTEDERALLNYFIELYKTSNEYSHFDLHDSVTLEIASAGIGAYHSYYAMRSKYPELVEQEFDALFESTSEVGEKSRLLFQNYQNNQLSQKAIDVVLRILGYAIGNAACHYLPYGGIYIIGGVAQKNWQLISENKSLLEGIYAKPAHIREMIQNMPVYLTKQSVNPGLNGVLYLAKRKFSEVQLVIT